MARSHGRLFCRIWDSDFTQLTRSAQGMYSFILSQPDLNQAGLIALRLRRWATMAAEETVDSVIHDLEALEAARFLVIDWDHEEVLVRTVFRNDGVYKQPNVMLAAGSDALEIRSPTLRAALLVELDRIPLDELSSEIRGKAERSPREVVEGVIAGLRKVFGDSGAPPVTSQDGSGNPSRNPCRKGSDDPSTGVTGTFNARVSPSPTTTPTPTDFASPPARKTTTPPDDLAEVTAQHVTGVWIDAIRETGTEPTKTLIGQASRAARELLTAGNDPQRVLEAARSSGRAGYATIAQHMARMNGNPAPTQRRGSTTDARVQQALDIAAELESPDETAFHAITGGKP